ncbi:hypothetical protein ATCC90586_003747 [Pythium insidiosum]|nr:hypothetical protein ATCC90586_003747 [Pythium insidiosum]
MALKAALAVVASLACVHAHSWIDCLDTDRAKLYDRSAEYIFGGSKGNGFCAGYGAGFPGRGVADIGPMYTHKMLKNEIDAGTAVCQRVDANSYQGWRKRLSVAAGVPVYFSYLENGHVSKDKMGRGTKYGIYWTGKPGTRLTSTREMTRDRLVDGKLSDFDDGNCGETLDASGKPSGRAGDGKPCIGQFTVPPGTAPGVYHFVWYWTFFHENENNYVDKDRAKGYFGAAYSTCFEVEIKASDRPSYTFDDALKGQGGAAPASVSAATPTPAPAPTPAAPRPTPGKPQQQPPPSAPAPTTAPTKPPTPAPTPAMRPSPTPAASTPSGKLDFNSYSPDQLADAVSGAKQSPSTPPHRPKGKGKSKFCV